MSALAQSGVQWLGLVVMAFALVAALAALAARSAFAMILYLTATAALAAVALLSLRAGAAGVGLALFGVGIAPVLLMGAVLLSARASKRTRWPWASTAIGAAVMAPIGWALSDLRQDVPMAGHDVGVSGLWLATLAFVAALGGVGLLGFGERGVLQGGRGDDRS